MKSLSDQYENSEKCFVRVSVTGLNLTKITGAGCQVWQCLGRLKENCGGKNFDVELNCLIVYAF